MVTNLITINKQKKLSLKPSKGFKSSKCDIYTIHKQMGSNGEMSQKKSENLAQLTAPQLNSDSRFQGTLVDHIPGWHVFLQKLHRPFLGWAHLLTTSGPWHLAPTTAGPGHLQGSAFDDEKRCQKKGHGTTTKGQR